MFEHDILVLKMDKDDVETKEYAGFIPALLRFFFVVRFFREIDGT